MLPTIPERVSKGAAFLDKHKPGWYDAIDLETLNMASSNRCVLAQLYRSYSRAQDLLGLSTGSCHDMGFTDNSCRFESLDSEWAYVIETLQAADRGCDFDDVDTSPKPKMFTLFVNGQDFSNLTWAQVTALVESVPTAELLISRSGE